MNASNQSKSVVYHTTSVNAARSFQTTIARAGQKRKPEESLEAPAVANKVVVISGIAHKGDFSRPSVRYVHPPPLTAGQVVDAVERGQSAYSQRRGLALTPHPTNQPRLDLAHPAYGLPGQLIKNLASLGIRSIYPWQSECLLQSGALAGQKNLVYTAPTGGGKSLVADVLMLKKILENPEQKALLVLPYVALVQEKLRWLRKVVEGITKPPNPSNENNNKNSIWRKRGDEDSFRVAGFFGGSKSKATWDDMDIAICTIEKANSLVNSALEDGTVGKLGIVVMDELHMIDDENRGYILELMATKLLCLDQGIQLVGMSATLNNAQTLAAWLGNAKFYISRYRPVPIEEHLVFDNNAYPAMTSSMFYKTATQLNTSQSTQGMQVSSTQSAPVPARTIKPSSDKELSNSLLNSVVALANETARSGYGALVFCSSRKGCELDAQLIGRVLPRPEEVYHGTMSLREDLLNDLRNTSTGLDTILEQTVPVGVAYHHAGLTTEERDLIADAYDKGIIKVIAATCSLAAGINLPARRVILHGARMGPDLVGPSMLGRAGRKGKDEIGETYLCCQKSDLEAVAELMEAEIPSVQSCLVPGKRGIKRALLEVVATKLAISSESIDEYIQKTLLYQTMDHTELQTMVQATMQELLDDNLILITNTSEYTATLLGQAIVTSSLTPEDGLFVHRELQKALQAFVLDGEMHVLYSFTPVNATSTTINWQTFQKEIERLDESNQRVLNFIGIKHHMINKMARGGTMKETTPSEIETHRIYKRFYTALQLRDLCNEMPIHSVAKKYDLPRGSIQNLAQTCHGFAAGMIKFCGRMGWGALGAILDHFSDRLRAGAKADLLSLSQISFIKSRTARVFWENGFKTIGAIAAADIKDILPVLLMAQPKKLKTSSYDETKFLEKLTVKAERIVSSANAIWEREIQAELDEEEDY